MNSKNFKRTQSSLYINSNQFTSYHFKSIQFHFKSISNELQVQFKSIQTLRKLAILAASPLVFVRVVFKNCSPNDSRELALFFVKNLGRAKLCTKKLQKVLKCFWECRFLLKNAPKSTNRLPTSFGRFSRSRIFLELSFSRLDSQRNQEPFGVI